MRVKKTKALRYVIATFLTMGTVLSIGFLSFFGAWAIWPSIAVGCVAFFLSGSVEGKVFQKSISKGLSRLKLLGSNSLQHLLILELDLFIKREMEKERDWHTKECQFIQDYLQQKKYYKFLKKTLNAIELNEDQLKKLKEAKKRLEELKSYFYQKISDPNFKGNDYLKNNLRNYSELVLLKEAKRNLWFLSFFGIISISVGVGAGFATAFVVNEAITVGLGLSLSIIALSTITWSITIFAAIGATFLLYYAITDIVKNEVIAKAFDKTRDLFKRESEESKISYGFRCFILSIIAGGILLLTGFSVFASAGTSWFIMRKGMLLLAPKLPVFIAFCTSVILIPITFATDLIYGFSTTLQTVSNCKNLINSMVKGIIHPFKTFKSIYTKILNHFKEIKNDETWLQFFNPFRILAKLIISPLQSLIFIGHLISIGFTTDRCLNFPPPLVAGACAVSEGLQDLSFLTTEEDHDHDHDHGDLLQLPLQVLLSPILITIGILYWIVKKCGNEIGIFDAIAQIFELPLLNIVFFPLLLPSAIWHWIFKKETDNLTFFKSVKQNFEICSHDHAHGHEEESTFELSEQWREEVRPKWILDTAKDRLNSAKIAHQIALEKQNCLDKLASNGVFTNVINELKDKRGIDDILQKKELEEANKCNGYSAHEFTNGLETQQQDSFWTILNRPRGIFFKDETTTLKIVKDAFSEVCCLK